MQLMKAIFLLYFLPFTYKASQINLCLCVQHQSSQMASKQFYQIKTTTMSNMNMMKFLDAKFLAWQILDFLLYVGNSYGNKLKTWSHSTDSSRAIKITMAYTVEHISTLLILEYFRRTRPIPWWLMLWLLALPHNNQHQWYLSCEMMMSLSRTSSFHMIKYHTPCLPIVCFLE